MRIFCLSILATLACTAAVNAKDDAHAIPFRLGWRVTISADGRVTQMSPIANKRFDRFPQIRQRLEQAIHDWRFSPGEVGGKPAITQTGLFVRAELLPANNDSYRIKVDHAGVGGTIKRSRVPHYPELAVAHHKTGEVVLRLSYDAAGKVVSANPLAGSPTADALLIRASQRAAREWTFQPEVVGGHPLAGAVILPFCYRLRAWGSSHRQGKCNWIARGETRPLQSGEALALNPAAHVLTDMAGATL